MEEDFLEEDNVVESEDEWLLTEEEAYLLYPSPHLEYRTFRIINSNSTIYGVLLKETEDSFLVALPARLETAEDNSQLMVSVIPRDLGVARFLKANIFIVAEMRGGSLEAYRLYLKTLAPELYPDLIEELDLDCKVPDDSDEGEFLDEVEQKVEDAILNGSFVRGSSDTIH